ncbi:MAG: response regulator [Desulfobacterales bacterium]|jgi:excisionase family DNA binding protein
MAEKKDVFTIPRAAEYCSIHRVTLWRWVKSGELKSFHTPGGHFRILKQDLESFMREKGMLFPSHKDLNKKKILIVDDDNKIHELLTKILSSNGYKVEVASDGFEAGANILRFKPDLMILDLFMPGMDGFEVCKRIKTDPDASHIKILAITGFDTDENRKRIMQAGADGYLAKPMRKRTLLQNIEEIFEQ